MTMTQRNVDDNSLLAVIGTREVHAPPMQHYLDAFDGPETRAAVKARDGALDAIRAFASRIDEIRRSRMLTDAERAALRLQAADAAIKKLEPLQGLVAMNGEKVETREAALKPASGGYESDAQLAVDLQLLARFEAMSGERRTAFFEALGSEPTKLEVRFAEAVVRSGLLGSITPADWTRAHDLLFEHKNRQALVELRAIRAATEQTGRFLAEARRMIESEVALERSRNEPAAGGFVEVPAAA
jgi:hypothetical protein